MDLVFGHPLADRRATQEIRLFKYADRGFGLRILPSYAKSLEKDNLDKHVSNANGEEKEESPFWQKSRKPQGAEPGLKTLRRIAYLGQNYTQRFYFGSTPICKWSKRRWPGAGLWLHLRDRIPAVNDMLQAANDQGAKDGGFPLPSLTISLCDLDSRKMQEDLPGGRKAIGGFELFMRHCEAWRLHACKKAM